MSLSLLTELFPPARGLLSPTMVVLTGALCHSSFLVLSFLLDFEHVLYSLSFQLAADST